MYYNRIFCAALVLFIMSVVSSGKAMTYQDTLAAADLNVNSNIKSAISDPTYPVYHLRAPSGWINDPCGLFYYNSSFHIFVQSNPWGNMWGNMAWSHIVSSPNKKWDYKWFYPRYQDGKVKTTAISPSLDSSAADKNGVFTGSVAVLPFKEKDKAGRTITTYYPAALYSAVWGTHESRQEVIAMARALDANKISQGKLVDPHLTEWTKYSTYSKNDPNNHPDVILRQPADLNLISFRDPYIFRMPDDKNYYMIVSAGIKNKNAAPSGVILLFKNDGQDLTKNWVRVNKGKNFFFSTETAVKDAITKGGNIECGVVYRLTDHIGTTNGSPYIIIFGQDGSPAKAYSKAMYYTLGNIVKSKNGIVFEPLDSFKEPDGKARKKLLDLNPEFVFYSSNLLPVDNEQRHFLVSWLNIGSQANDGKTYNWAGALSVPRFLFVYKENGIFKLGQDPILVNALRRKNVFSSQKVKFSGNNSVLPLRGVKGRHLNLVAEFKSANITADTFGFQLAVNGKKYFPVTISQGKLIINNRKPLDLQLPSHEKRVKLDMYLDGAILEIFISKYVNGNFISYRTYSCALPSTGNVLKEGINITGSENITAAVDVYEMDTCWSTEQEVSAETEQLNKAVCRNILPGMGKTYVVSKKSPAVK
ncbi:GH32 C-terminal domain-containing protein [Lentisphaerota bacterium ZTH]|nr:GH32 C-terminal domain-containing protein [Lentisphaerota bacterium]WET07411.1 GH32 C-terminal domain-containing protein [Lentisphaerota bacterium ZTH]